MPISIKGTNLVYYPVPKVASTSIRLTIDALNEKHSLLYKKPPSKKDIRNIHSTYPTRAQLHPLRGFLADSFERVAVIRDPIKRVLSAYSNRVVHDKVLSEKRVDTSLLQSMNLPLNPDLNTFLLRLPEYCIVSEDIAFHVRGFQTFLGGAIHQFDHIFKIEDIRDFEALLSERCNEHVSFGREQTEGPKYTVDDVSKDALALALRFYRYDYYYLMDYYSPQDYGGIPTGNLSDPSSLFLSNKSRNKIEKIPSPRKVLSLYIRGKREHYKRLFINP